MNEVDYKFWLGKVEGAYRCDSGADAKIIIFLADDLRNILAENEKLRQELAQWRNGNTTLYSQQVQRAAEFQEQWVAANDGTYVQKQAVDGAEDQVRKAGCHQ